MAAQTVFKRYEFKYLLTQEQRQKVVQAMEPYMQLDKYGHKTIRNIYYDTDDYLLIRRSIEKPVYKEKLRIRSYHQATAGSEVYVELKKKYQSVVYKRRIELSELEAMNWISGRTPCPKHTQISEEIDYFIQYYKTLHPSVFLSYERDAYCPKDDSDLRVTFDDTILCRQEDMSLESEIYGDPILPDGYALMEIKCSGGMPLWMTHVLSEEHLYKTSFSKYGTAYKNLIFPKLHHTNTYIPKKEA